MQNLYSNVIIILFIYKCNNLKFKFKQLFSLVKLSTFFEPHKLTNKIIYLFSKSGLKPQRLFN